MFDYSLEHAASLVDSGIPIYSDFFRNGEEEEREYIFDDYLEHPLPDHYEPVINEAAV